MIAFAAGALFMFLLHVPIWFSKYMERPFLAIKEYRLESDVTLYSTDGKAEVGYLKKGALVYSPSFRDLDTTDLGDNQRYKIIIDFTTEPYPSKMKTVEAMPAIQARNRDRQN